MRVSTPRVSRSDPAVVADLDGAVVAVTAAGAGIGRAITVEAAAAGAKVVAADRDISGLGGLGPRIDVVACDQLDPAAGRLVVDTAVASHGRLDAVVSCLGGPQPGLALLERDDDVWQQAFELNLMCAVRLVRAAIPALRRGGSILFIGSDLARQPDPAFVDYAAMKAALLSFSKSISIEFGPDLRSNVLSPGPTRTPGLLADFERALGPDPDPGAVEIAIDSYVREQRQMPLGRLADADEIARAAIFLISDAAAAITGAELVADGGVRKAS
jgi:NAD(P)-dependent dehydrogenase (short-subunit alcohol dehydrogenase family)